MPAATKIGANTFGCCINGDLLIPRNGTGTLGGNDDGLSYFGGYPEVTDYYELDARDYKSSKTSKILIHIHEVHLKGIGDYQVDESNGSNSIDGLNHNYIHCKIYNNDQKEYQYYLSFENSGNIQITNYDFAKGIISGTFTCRVKNTSNPDDIIEIKDGRFDINGYTLPSTSFP